MGVLRREQFIVTSEAQLAMTRYGIPNPVEAAMAYDIDVEALRMQVAALEEAKEIILAAQAALPERPPKSWAGSTATAWNGCVVTFWDVLLRIWDFLVWLVEALLYFIDVIIEILRWLAEIVTFILDILSIIGAIEVVLDALGVSVPGWTKQLFKFLKSLESKVKLGLAYVVIAAYLLVKLGPLIDQFLDSLREDLESYRQSVAGCLGTGPHIEDEPIGPAPVW